MDFKGCHMVEPRNDYLEITVLCKYTATAKSLQSCPTLCDPIDSSPPRSLIPGILQARTLEWVAMSFSNAWKWKVKGKSLSRVRPSATPWTAAFQARPSMGFSRQEYWSGVPLPSPCFAGDPPNKKVENIRNYQEPVQFYRLRKRKQVLFLTLVVLTMLESHILCTEVLH